MCYALLKILRHTMYIYLKPNEIRPTGSNYGWDGQNVSIN